MGELGTRREHRAAARPWPDQSRRLPVVRAVCDAGVWSAALCVVGDPSRFAWVIVAVAAVAFQGVFGFAFGLYRPKWTLGAVHVVRRVVLATVCAAVAVSLLPFRTDRIPRSALALATLLAIVGELAVRLVRRRLRRAGDPVRRVVVIGASPAAEAWLSTLRQSRAPGYVAVVVLDDDPSTLSTRLVGVPVQGRIDYLAVVAERYRADSVLIADGGHGADEDHTNRIRRLAQPLGLDVFRLPAFWGTGLRLGPLRPVIA